MTNETIQAIITALSVLAGSGLTFFAQNLLIKKQFSLNKQKIKFEKNREDLATLKSYQTTIVYELTSLKSRIIDFSKKQIDVKTYKYLTKHNIILLEDIISKAYMLHNKQLDFEVGDLTQLYHDIDTFLKKAIQNDKYTNTGMIAPIIKTCNLLIARSKESLKEIIRIAEEEN